MNVARIVSVLFAAVAIRNAGFPTPSKNELPPVDKKGWYRAHHDGTSVAAIVIPSVLVGIALFVGLGVAMANSTSHWGPTISGW